MFNFFYWKIWIRFKRKMIGFGLCCEYCMRFGKSFLQKKTLKHKLGEEEVGGIYHKECFRKSLEFYKWYVSGKVEKCIDCKRDFYLSHRPGEDCPAKGMAQDHRIKGEENLIML